MTLMMLKTKELGEIMPERAIKYLLEIALTFIVKCLDELRKVLLIPPIFIYKT